SGSQDIILMNGVLEWLPLSEPEMRPDKVQLGSLRRAWEMLSTGGQLYLGIENRMSISMFRGNRDHSGLKYTGLMPRCVANLICRRFPRRYRSEANVGYRTYTYTLWGYKRMLRKAGFHKVRAYWPIPGYNEPYQVIPIKNRILKYWESNYNCGRLWRLIRT